ncbi:MAG: YqiA/YcfP family alpha/beta fold hydrolase [Myxococcota bacterium]
MSQITNRANGKVHVMYLHGLEGSPEGTKGRWVRRYFGAVAPSLPASADNIENSFYQSYRVAQSAIEVHQPDVIVGSSFGGGVLMKLLQAGDWSGNAVMLAPAGVKYGVGDHVPEGSHVILIHSPSDAVVPYEDSECIVKNSAGRAELWPAEFHESEIKKGHAYGDGNHRLYNIIESGMFARAIISQIRRSMRT